MSFLGQFLYCLETIEEKGIDDSRWIILQIANVHKLSDLISAAHFVSGACYVFCAVYLWMGQTLLVP